MTTSKDPKDLNHPNGFVRRLVFCPICGGGKERGLLVCWPCHNTLKARHDGGYGERVDRLLDKIEHSCAINGDVLYPPVSPYVQEAD